MDSNDVLIRVHSDWDGWRSAEVRLCDVEDVHWFRPAGAPRALLHAYVACTRLVAGSLRHACDGATAPHRLLVCVLKHHATAPVYAKLAAAARSGPLWDTPVMPQARTA